ncbi:ParB/RepB/Spo0J family partition protein [Butyricicoccus sp.]|uniref:ParB/RepB/Spo0J family partition protein n=1 Tax=Butyricicoccus sp. TaxID=2049021 RepID=UPI002A881FA1|nr:ParB/RepB/Spo0J family partition protein [Butyricicoccus sp.]
MANKSLGRGLSALFGEENMDAAIPPTSAEPVRPKNGFRNIPLRRIEPNRAQPRREFDEAALQELENSIRLHGVLAPITVRLGDNGYYQIVAGERRWRAARRAGLDSIPAMVIDADDQTMMELALIENLQREDLNPMEEAEGYRALIDQFGMKQETVAERVGRSRSAVANSLRLLSLDEDIRKLVVEGKLSSGHARAVLAVQQPDKRLAAAKTMMESGMSVRQAEAYVKRLNQPKQEKTEQPVKEFQPDYYAEVQRKLEGSLGRRVQIDHKKNKGKITLEYYGDEDLERLANALAAAIL